MCKILRLSFINVRDYCHLIIGELVGQMRTHRVLSRLSLVKWVKNVMGESKKCIFSLTPSLGQRMSF